MACGLEIKTGSKVVLEIKNDVAFKGGIGEDGIRVHQGADLEIIGSGNLYCSGNNEEERIKQYKSQLGLYYGTVGFDPAVPQATKSSQITTPGVLDAYKSHTKYDGNTEKHILGGSGIGYANDYAGNITINGDVNPDGTPALHITAKGFGRGAFGIGGGDQVKVEINNAVIEEARGGYSTINKMIQVDGVNTLVPADYDADLCIYEEKTFAVSTYDDDPDEVKEYVQSLLHPASDNKTIGLAFQQCKNEAEGGCAIGVGGDPDGATDYGKIVLNNVVINKAVGGAKAAAIGGYYWSAVDVEVNDSELHDIKGGVSASAIGGSRYNEAPASDTSIIINNTKLYDVQGGQFASAIGSGYNPYTTEMEAGQKCHIEIKGASELHNIKGGMAAAAIGTGYHQSQLDGFIDELVVLDNIKGGNNWADFDYYALPADLQSKYLSGKPNGGYSFGYYADNRYGTLSKVQDIGYGTLYTHGLNNGNKTVDGVKQYWISGRECVDNAYLEELGYKIKGLTEAEKNDLVNALKADGRIFEGFDRSVVFTVAGQTIPNPRLRENNLSRLASDCPAEWLD